MNTNITNQQKRELVMEALSEQMASLTTKRKEYKAMINRLDASDHYERIAMLQELIRDIDTRFYEVLDYYISLQKEAE